MTRGDYRNPNDTHDSEFDDDSDDPQWEDVAGDDDDADALAEMMCPACRACVTEDTQKCPKCGDWITPVEPKAKGMRRWLWAIFIVFLVIQTLMLFVP